MIFRLFFFAYFASSFGFGQESAYYEQIITPHWVEHRSNAAGTVEALFLVNDLARREPDELAQRFDLAVSKLRTLRGSNAYKNVFDIDSLTAGLEATPDVLVVAAQKPWKDLGPKGVELATNWVSSGGSLVVFTRNPPEKELDELSVKSEASEFRDLTEGITDGLDLEPVLPGRLRDSFNVTQVSHGEGTITFARPFDRAYVRFNAFFPKLGEWDDPEVAAETAYLLANRIIRHAAGKVVENPGITVAPSSGAVDLSGALSGSDAQLRLQVRSASGQLLTEASATKLPVSIPVPTTGPVTVVWEELNTAGHRLAMGTTRVEMSEAKPFEVSALTSPHPRNEPVTIKWAPIPGHDNWQVEAEMYDADRNLIRFAAAPASTGQLEIPLWQTRQVSHRVRVLLTGPKVPPESISPSLTTRKTQVRGDRQILAEHFQWLHLRADPEADRRQWTTLTWGDERGHFATRWRAHRLRSLGLNATAPIGKSVETSLWASASGLRVVPTNVFVPQNRYNKKSFDEEQSKGWLKEFATGVRPLSPLGYSFADEPPKEVILPWLDKGGKVLDSADPDARFGYCGVWPGPYSPELMRKSGYLGLYSPGHLYNLNIWLGIERDIYRSFRDPDGIVTLWTHYAPWADHEPYSRTVPWVWLFDGMDGVGYFKSAGMMFGILDGDLRSTHETRWWSEEIHELNAGIAEQVKRMQRDVGAVRILFGGDLKAVEPWARALNELSIPYQFLEADELKTEDLKSVSLLVAVDGGEIDATIEEFVRAGGTLVGGGGLASVQETSSERFEQLFGFAPTSVGAGEGSDFSGIRASVAMGELVLEGLTTGECLPAVADRGSPWNSIGGGGSVPERLKAIADSNAVRISSDGRAMYLALRPDLNSVRAWLPTLLNQAGITLPDVRLMVGDSNEVEDRVYVTQFSDGVAQMVGLTPDYIRISPSQQIEEIEANPRDSDDSIQKQQLGYFAHGPQRWSPIETRLRLGDEKHVYDVRRGEYLGQLSDPNLSLQPGRPELFALLPYSPPELKIEMPAEATSGTDFTFSVAIESDAVALAQHVIRVELIDLSGQAVPGATANLQSKDGSVAGRFSVPHDAEPGDYRLLARDILTGTKNDLALSVLPPQQIASAPLPPYDFQIKRHPVDWPAGDWQPILEDTSSAKNVPASATVKALQRKTIHYGKYGGKEHLMSGFTIANGLRTYEMKYLTCCDRSVFDPGPPQQVQGLNGSGLGLNKPRGHLWYYNSYLKVFLGEGEEEMALGYELKKIEDRSDETGGRVRLEWEAPSATVRIDYAMIPGHEGLFHEMTIEPHESKPLSKTTVNLYSYPAGFGKGTEPFFEVAQEHREWLLMGDAIRDRAFYESGKGSAGLLIRPEEWAEVKYSARPVLKAERPESDATKPWRLQWVTWMFPDRGNAAAKEYMQTNSEATRQQLLEVFAD